MCKINITKLSKDNTRYLNEINREIKKDYIEAVNRQSIYADNKLAWYATPFGSKNTYVCNVMEVISKILLIKRITNEKNLKEIIVDDVLQKEILREILPDNIKIKCINNEIWRKIQIIKDMVNILAYLSMILMHYIAYSLAKGLNKKLKKYKKEEINIIETILYRNSFDDKYKLKDRHFDTLTKKENSERNVIFPIIYGLFNYYTFYRRAIKSNHNIIFIQDLVPLKKIILPIIWAKKNKYKMGENFIIDEVNFIKIAEKSLRKHRFKPSTLYGYLRYIAIKNFEDKKYKIEKVIRWHENHEVDHMAVAAWRELNSPPKILGYADMFPPNNYLSPYVTDQEIKSKIYPDKMFVIGEYWRKEFNKCNTIKADILVTCSYRFNFSSNNFMKNYNQKKLTQKLLIFSLPANLEGKKQIIKILSDFENELNDAEIKDYQFLLRPHPSDATKIKLKFKRLKIQIDSITEFESLLSKCMLVISAASSVQLQALLSGVRAVTVSKLSKLSDCAVPVSFNGFGHDEIFDAKELVMLMRDMKNTNTIIMSDIEKEKYVSIEKKYNLASEF